ncbi:hypothetical protein Y032_0033g2630 [Ancylostoma ceylanicum]|uniref:Uncharacterized protein n=1 Tax=Ancylostoma ceylanicum TaxID=53326 RepID=A0A016UMG6_9BILA|nr:hypothetical protein Y032_0033g2630 [Ancylostoma ceylanicum]
MQRHKLIQLTPGLRFMKRQPGKPTMANMIGYLIDYVTLRGAGHKSWFANLVSVGFALMNPTLGGFVAV